MSTASTNPERETPSIVTWNDNGIDTPSVTDSGPPDTTDEEGIVTETLLVTTSVHVTTAIPHYTTVTQVSTLIQCNSCTFIFPSSIHIDFRTFGIISTMINKDDDNGTTAIDELPTNTELLPTERTTLDGNMRSLNFASGWPDASISDSSQNSVEGLDKLSVYFTNLEKFMNTTYQPDKPFVDVVSHEIIDILNMNVKFLKELNSDFNSGLNNLSRIEHLSESLILGRELLMNYHVTPDVADSLALMSTIPWIQVLLHKVKEDTNLNFSSSEQQVLDTLMGNIMPLTYHYVNINEKLMHNLTTMYLTENIQEYRRKQIILLEEVADQLLEAKRSLYLSRHSREVVETINSYDTIINILQGLLKSTRSYSNASDIVMKENFVGLKEISAYFDRSGNVSDTKLMEMKWLIDQLLEDTRICKSAPDDISSDVNCKILLNLNLTQQLLSLKMKTLDSTYDYPKESTSPKESMLPNDLHLSTVIAFLDVIEAGLPLETKMIVSHSGPTAIMDFVKRELSSLVDFLEKLEHDIWSAGSMYERDLTNQVQRFLVVCDLMEKYSNRATDDVLTELKVIRSLVSNIRDIINKSFEMKVDSRSSLAGFHSPCSEVTEAASQGLINEDVKDILSRIQSYLELLNTILPSEVESGSNDKSGFSYFSKQLKNVRMALVRLENDLLGTISSTEQPFSPQILRNFADMLQFAEKSQIQHDNYTLEAFRNMKLDISAVLQAVSEAVYCIKTLLPVTVPIPLDSVESTVTSYPEGQFTPVTSKLVASESKEDSTTSQIFQLFSRSDQVPTTVTSTQIETSTPAVKLSSVLETQGRCSQYDIYTEKQAVDLLANLKDAEEYLQLLVTIEPLIQTSGIKLKPRVAEFLNQSARKVTSVLGILDGGLITKQAVWRKMLSQEDTKMLVRMATHVKKFTLSLSLDLIERVNEVKNKSISILKNISDITECLHSAHLRPQNSSINTTKAVSSSTTTPNASETRTDSPPSTKNAETTQSTSVINESLFNIHARMAPEIENDFSLGTMGDTAPATGSAVSTVPAPGTTTSTVPAPGTTASTVPAPGTTASTVPAPGTTASTTPAPGTTASTTPATETTSATHTTGSSIFSTLNNANIVTSVTSLPTDSGTTFIPVTSIANVSLEIVPYLENVLIFLQTLNVSLPWNLQHVATQDSGFARYLKTTSTTILRNLEIISEEPFILENLRIIKPSRAEQFVRMMKYATSSGNLRVSHTFKERLDHMVELLNASLARVSNTLAGLKGQGSGNTSSLKFSSPPPMEGLTRTSTTQSTTKITTTTTKSPSTKSTTANTKTPITKDVTESNSPSYSTKNALTITTESATTRTTGTKHVNTNSLETTSTMSSLTSQPSSKWEASVALLEKQNETLSILKQIRTELQTIIDSDNINIYSRMFIPQAVEATIQNMSHAILDMKVDISSSSYKAEYETVMTELREFASYDSSDKKLKNDRVIKEMVSSVDRLIFIVESDTALLSTEINALEEELLGPILEGHHVGMPLPAALPLQNPSTSDSSSPPASQVHGLISGYKIELLAESFQQPFVIGDNETDFVVNNMDKIRNVEFRSRLNVSQVNGVNMTRLQEHGVLLDAPEVRVPLTFSSAEVTGQVTAAFINGIPAEDYVTKDGNFTFTAPVRFTESTEMKDDVIIASTINGIDLSEVTSNMAFVSGDKHFKTDLVFGDLVVESDVESTDVNVSGVAFNDTVKRNESAVITGPKTFLAGLEVTSGPVIAGDVTAEIVDGVNVNDLFFGSLRKSPTELQVIEGSFKIASLEVKRDLTSRGFTVLPKTSGVPLLLNFTSFSERVVYLDEDRVISGDLTLHGNTEVNTLHFYDTFDQVPHTHYQEGWLLTEGNQTLTGSLTCSVMNAGNVMTLPGITIQGVDIRYLDLFSMKVDEDETFLGPAAFDLIVSEGPVTVDGLVQGWDLSSDAISISPGSSHRPLVFTGRKRFLGEVSYEGAFDVDGRVNGVDFGSLCPVLNLGHLSVDSANFLSLVKVDEAHLGKNRIILDADFANSFWRSDQPAVLSGRFTFREVEAVHITTDSKINSVNLKAFNSSVLRNQCHGGSQEVLGSFTFENLTVSSLQTSTIETDTIDEWTANDMYNIMTQDEEQVITGHMQFDNVTVIGSINPITSIGGLEMTEFCVYHEPCILKAEKHFQNLTVLGNHTVKDNSTVQGVDVSEALKDAITKTSCGFIPGVTTFAGGLNISHLWTTGLVDGVNLTSSEILTLSGNQVMSGYLTIIGVNEEPALSAQSLTSDDGLFNFINLTKLWDTSVRIDRVNVIAGQINFFGNVIFNEVVLNHTLDSVLSLINSPPDFTDTTKPYKYLYNVSRLSHYALEGQAREFWGWRRVQAFPEPLVRLVPLVMDPLLQGRPSSSTSEYLALISSLGSTRLYKLHDNGLYEDTDMTLGGTCTNNVVGYTSHGREFVVTGHVCLDTKSTDGEESLGDQDVLIWEITDGEAKFVSSISTPGAADLQAMMLQGTPCLAVVAARASETLITCEASPGRFKEMQRLITGSNPVKATVVDHVDPSGRSHKFLGVADKADTLEHRGSFTLWRYYDQLNTFKSIQVMHMDDVKWVEMTSHRSDLFLVIVSGAFRGDQEGQVLVYRMNWFEGDGTSDVGHYGIAEQSINQQRWASLRSHPQFYFVQELVVEEPSEARFYTLPSGELRLYVIRQDGMVVRFSQKGIQRFWKDGELHAAGKVTLDVWSSWVEGRVVHRLNAGGSSCQDLEKRNFPEEPAVVLEAIFRGGLDSEGQPSCPVKH